MECGAPAPLSQPNPRHPNDRSTPTRSLHSLLGVRPTSRHEHRA